MEGAMVELEGVLKQRVESMWRLSGHGGVCQQRDVVET
jgi:hypothetical protein